MNVKELKKLARDWVGATPRSGLEIAAAQAMNDAIMALPDDYQLVDVNKVIGDHQDLVEMAQKVTTQIKNVGFATTSAEDLAHIIIDRFGKREPRKVEMWVISLRGKTVVSNFESREQAVKFIKEHGYSNEYRIARLTGTEEV